MKRNILILLLLMLTVFLSSCSDELTPPKQILVSIQENRGFTVENNGALITPGEDITFYLNMESGFSVAGTNYNGEYQTKRQGSYIALTLEQVKYPTQITLELTARYCSITYHPNGGFGEETTISYDTSRHLRPNTSIGSDIFYREGYTLTGWNTTSDGSGIAVGLGSRVTVENYDLALYAQWAQIGRAHV